ncbi:MAG: transposase [Nostoc sp. JL31]|uniref:transposase n=1 Tax=Nostoc sp. JL31 TaxID=2815395 RepID=UPI0025FD95E3|nr:transposase [Nostoc sp. JL31]MBN3892578.1 transposase [Nostoc sp. JL31]
MLSPVKELKWTENIIPICQPAYCPQLNPIERFWLFLKSQIKGQVFNTLEELRDRLNEVLSKITSERVISLTFYDFILEALFYAASM